VGWGQPSLFFPSSFLFRFIYFFTCFATASARLPKYRLARPFNEGSTPCHLKKNKGSCVKDSSCNWIRECVEQSTSRLRGKRRVLKSRGKEGDGLCEGKGRDCRRHKVVSMLVRLGMNRAFVGVYRKNHLCINILFFKFQFEY
jgi:hypothetical protein